MYLCVNKVEFMFTYPAFSVSGDITFKAFFETGLKTKKAARLFRLPP